MIIRDRKELDKLIAVSHVDDKFGGNQYFEFDDYLSANRLINKFEVDTRVKEGIMQNISGEKTFFEMFLNEIFSSYSCYEKELECEDNEIMSNLLLKAA